MFQGLLGFVRPALLVAVGGALGALCRAASYLAVSRLGFALPWGTLAVNGLGAFAIGWFFGAGLEKVALGEDLRLLVVVGFLGALTTFSTFSKEAVQMMQAGQWGWMAAYVVGNNLACFAATLLGWRLAGGA
jgi:CrcB protein